MYQRCIMLGRICTDLTLEYVQGDIPVCVFRLAVDRPFRDKRGARVSDFFRVVCWRQLAVLVAEHFAKGRLILVDGRMENSAYEQNGIRRYATDLIAERVSFAGSNKGTPNQVRQPAPAAPALAPGPGEPPPAEGDLPF